MKLAFRVLQAVSNRCIGTEPPKIDFENVSFCCEMFRCARPEFGQRLRRVAHVA
jgi:hypothetical protein